MEINPNVENLEANSTSEDEVWGMPKYQQNYLSNLTNLTDEQYLAVVIILTVNVFRLPFEITLTPNLDLTCIAFAARPIMK